jgi:hypothetical protein
VRVSELDGTWDVRRTGGFLPPLLGMRKVISGGRGRTVLGPVELSFAVEGRTLRYEGRLAGFVDELEPAGTGFRGRATFRGTEYGRFVLERVTPLGAD